MKILTVLFLIFSFIYLSTAQQPSSFFIQTEDSVKVLLKEAYANDSVRFITSDKRKRELNKLIIQQLDTLLSDPTAFYYPFDSLLNIGKVYSNDKKIRILTWNFQYKDKSYEYFGYILYYNESKKEYRHYRLTDKSESLAKADEKTLEKDEWYGNLIYKAISYEDRNTTKYILLGWDGYDELITRKVIDVLFFDKNEEPVFGDDIFRYEGKKLSRVFFDFSSRGSMMLRYDEELKYIVFDHLAPTRANLTGQKQFYGPDGTQDAFFCEKGKWMQLSNVILKNKKQNQNNGNLFSPESNDFYKP